MAPLRAWLIVASFALVATMAARPEVRGKTVGEGEAASQGAVLDLLELQPPAPDTVRAGLQLATMWLGNGEAPAAAELLQQVFELAQEIGDDETAAAARTRLGAVDRHWLRPAAGRKRWSTARPSGTELKKPSGIAARGDGQLIVTDRALDTVMWLDERGSIVETWRVAGAERPKWTASGNVRVESKGSTVTLGPGGSTRRGGPSATMPPGAEGDLVDETRDTTGRRFALDRKGGLFLQSTEGDWTRHPARLAIRRPAALAADALGNLYVLDGAEKKVVVVDLRGRILIRVGPLLPGGLELGRPEDIALDDAGRLYFADRKVGIVVLE